MVLTSKNKKSSGDGVLVCAVLGHWQTDVD